MSAHGRNQAQANSTQSKGRTADSRGLDVSDFDMGNTGLFNMTGMVPPPPRLEQISHHQPKPTAAPGIGETNGAGPAGHALPMSQGLQAFCGSLNDSARARQSRTSKRLDVLKPYVHPNLAKDVKSAARGHAVRRSSPHKTNLRNSFATAHKPVVFLDTEGFTEYVFVYVEGGWRGFDSAFRPLPDTSGPVDAMMNICSRSNAGMWFTQYDVDSEFRVIERHAEKPDDAHAHDDGSTEAFRSALASDDELRGRVESLRDLDGPKRSRSRSSSIRLADSVSGPTSGSVSSAEVSPLSSPILKPTKPAP
jgi:hypothetical protein